MATVNEAVTTVTTTVIENKAEINRAKLVWVRANPEKAQTRKKRKIAQVTGVNPGTTGWLM